MQTLPDAHIKGLAESCVTSMGDIFWDFVESRDAPLGLPDPSQVAIDSVASALQRFATSLESVSNSRVHLQMEYREIVARIAENREIDDIVAALVSDAAWTESGARAILQLAQSLGVSMLRNALALAEALEIEDGECGM